MNRMRNRHPRCGVIGAACTRPPRCLPHGAIMVAVLVCVGLTGLLMLEILHQVVARRAEVDLAGRVLQARWLAEAALERAAARLAEDPAYPGETWRLAADSEGTFEGGTVAIQVRPGGGPKPHRHIRVQADYPDDPSYRVRATKEIRLEIPPKTTPQR